MVILAALPGMVRELLVTGNLAKPGNFSVSVNFLGYRIRKVGLGAFRIIVWSTDIHASRCQFRPATAGPSCDLGLTFRSRCLEAISCSLPRKECVYAFLLLSCRQAFYGGPIPPTRRPPCRSQFRQPNCAKDHSSFQDRVGRSSP